MKKVKLDEVLKSLRKKDYLDKIENIAHLKKLQIQY